MNEVRDILSDIVLDAQIKTLEEHLDTRISQHLHGDHCESAEMRIYERDKRIADLEAELTQRKVQAQFQAEEIRIAHEAADEFQARNAALEAVAEAARDEHKDISGYWGGLRLRRALRTLYESRE
jgi:uncharacterized protein YajQ (UPF0234 family)